MITLRHPWKITLVLIGALIPPLAVTLTERGPAGLKLLAAALAVSLIWDLIFTRARRQQPSWHSLPTALIVTVMTLPSLPLWQLALALSFGLVIGEQIFGGRGFGFLNAAAVTLAFLVFAFPGTALQEASPALGYATLPGLALLLAAGLVFWRVVFALALGLSVGLAMNVGTPPGVGLVLPAIFAVTFLVADPVASAATQAGRWLYGFAAGLLAALFTPLGMAEALVFAALLAGLAAPLIDDIVIRAQVGRRSARG